MDISRAIFIKNMDFNIPSESAKAEFLNMGSVFAHVVPGKCYKGFYFWKCSMCFNRNFSLPVPEFSW